jgi:hypothetical protein
VDWENVVRRLQAVLHNPPDGLVAELVLCRNNIEKLRVVGAHLDKIIREEGGL